MEKLVYVTKLHGKVSKILSFILILSVSTISANPPSCFKLVNNKGVFWLAYTIVMDIRGSVFSAAGKKKRSYGVYSIRKHYFDTHFEFSFYNFFTRKLTKTTLKNKENISKCSSAHRPKSCQ